MLEFRKFSEFPRGTMYDILQDAYSFDLRNQEVWDESWHESDDFFYDNLAITDQCGFVTCVDGCPIGFVTWDPRNVPAYVEIGHNWIRSAYKRKWYGRLQLQEALCRIRSYDGVKKVIVCTNSNLIAVKNYERVGFVLCGRSPNYSESAHTGDYLYYEMIL